jgi:hypothetical protein
LFSAQLPTAKCALENVERIFAESIAAMPAKGRNCHFKKHNHTGNSLGVEDIMRLMFEQPHEFHDQLKEQFASQFPELDQNTLSVHLFQNHEILDRDNNNDSLTELSNFLSGYIEAGNRMLPRDCKNKSTKHELQSELNKTEAT